MQAPDPAQRIARDLDSGVLAPTLRGVTIRTAPLRLSRRPAQILPILAIGLWIFVMFATLLINTAMMLQARRDIEVIATHAAKAGAQQIDYAAYDASCAPGETPASCARDLRLLTGTGANSAIGRSRDVALDWIRQNERSNALALVGRAPSGSSQGVSARLLNSNRTLEVTVTRCYTPFLVNVFTGSNANGCTNATAITATVHAQPVGGY